MIRRPPRATLTAHSFPTRRSSDLPFGSEGRVVRDEKEHRLLQPVHFISAGTRKPLPILMECLRVFDLARESRALARGSLFQLAGFSLARSLSLSSSSEANMSSALSNRSEERRVGKECVRTFRSRVVRQY